MKDSIKESNICGIHIPEQRQRGEKPTKKSWLKISHRSKKLKNFQAGYALVGCDKASCYVMSCPLKTPMGQGTKGSFQPTANQKLRPTVLQLLRN